MGRKAMDPDRFQMRDIKRRINALESANERAITRYFRLVAELRTLHEYLPHWGDQERNKPKD